MIKAAQVRFFSYATASCPEGDAILLFVRSLAPFFSCIRKSVPVLSATRRRILLGFFFSFLVVSCFLYRFDVYSFYTGYVHPDVNRDFVIAHQMVNYREFPFTGPNGDFGSGYNSPLYYYVIALPLLLFGDSVLTLQIFNLVMQCLIIIPLFFTVKNIFGLRAAFLAGFFFLVSFAWVQQVIYLWQPYLMQVFFIFALWFLSWAYRKKQRGYAYAAVVVFACGTVIHNSLIAVAPSFLILSVFCLPQALNYFKRILRIGAVFVAAELVLFLPVILFNLMHWGKGLQYVRVHGVIDPSPQVLITGFERLYGYLFNGWFQDMIQPGLRVAALCGLFALLLWYLIKEKDMRMRIIMFSILGTFLTTAYVVGSVQFLFSYDHVFPTRYFAPVLLPLLFLLAILLSKLSRIRGVGMLLAVVCTFILANFSANFTYLGAYAAQHPGRTLFEHILPDTFFTYTPSASSRAVWKYIEDNRLGDNFDVTVVVNSGTQLVLDYTVDILWSPILYLSHQRYLTLDDATLKGYRTVNPHPQYLFFDCWYMQITPCEAIMHKYYNDYTPLSRIFSEVHEGQVYVLKRS